jgi:hypothetical protein
VQESVEERALEGVDLAEVCGAPFPPSKLKYVSYLTWCRKALRRELLREVTLLRSVVRPTSPIARREKVRAWSS